MADGSPAVAAALGADLGTGFEAVDRDHWLAAVEEALRGRPFDELLVSSTRDGIEIQPLYSAADTDGDPAAFAVPADPARIAHGWDIRQRHHVGDPAEDPTAANAAILDDLRNGVTSVELVLSGVLSGGLPVGTRAGAALGGAHANDGDLAAVPSAEAEADDATVDLTGDGLAAVLEGVDLGIVPVTLAPHGELDVARSLAELTATVQPGPVAGAWLGLDPIGHSASAGGGASSCGLAGAAALAVEQTARLGTGRVFTVDGVRYANAGATPAQELGWMLATATAYLRALEHAGLGLPTAAAAIGLRISAGADQFATTAAVRALRGTWARVLDACGVAAANQSIEIQAVTAEAMFSRRDPWTNMLRSTSAVLGAVLGGADAVTVLPHDVLSRTSARDVPCSDAATGSHGVPSSDLGPGSDDALSRRLARNVQLLLAEESQIARLADPTAGSWYAESLTARLAEAAWAVFQEVEAAGGMEAAVGSGSVAAAAEQAADERSESLATRRRLITGVSEHPELPESVGIAARDGSRPAVPEALRREAPGSSVGEASDTPHEGLPDVPAGTCTDASTAGSGGSTSADSPAVSLAGLPDNAGTEAGEPSDASSGRGLPLRRPAAPFEELQDAAERAPQRPRVFAAALGDLATHTACSTWTANMLAVGGIELVGADRDGALSPLEAAASFAGSGCEAAVICSTDAFYAERAASTATALKEAGAAFVALAGRPEKSGEPAAVGVDEFWHEGIDVLAVLRRLHGIIGVSCP